VQLVGYDTGVGEDSAGPALLVATDGDVDRVSLAQGRDLAYRLGERHCAGSVEGDRHFSCHHDPAPYCRDHSSRWPCARCRGDCDLPIAACREEHAVYLAAFAPATFKVGVTRSWRLATRLREQGADRAAHIRTVSDGAIARQLEADIATDLGDTVGVPTKITGLHRSVDASAWRSVLADHEVIETFDLAYGLDLTDRPVQETLATGTVRGTQGRVLVLDNGGSTYAVDMRDLVGYESTTGGTDQQLQSSLGAFE
jgi:hypothetical protein